MTRGIDTTEADGLALIAVRGKALSPGCYLARRKTWGPEAASHMVFVCTLDDGERTRRGVFQVGSVEPEDLRPWVFRSRLMGLEHLTPVRPPHPRVQLAELVH